MPNVFLSGGRFGGRVTEVSDAAAAVSLPCAPADPSGAQTAFINYRRDPANHDHFNFVGESAVPIPNNPSTGASHVRRTD